jgi:radical SAM enzyme (TIGR01210 family)
VPNWFRSPRIEAISRSSGGRYDEVVTLPEPSPDDPIRRHLVEATQASGKTYAFDEQHDRSVPIAHWFQHSDDGPVLFIVLYTQACRWSCCTGCNLPSTSSASLVPFGDVIRQIDRVFCDPEVVARRNEIRKTIVSNNGSVLDEATFPTTALLHLLVRINQELPQMTVLSVETRAEYVDIEELEFLARVMRERSTPAEIELAVGFEAFDDDLRNGVFKKGLSLATFERLVDRIRHPNFRLKCYFMQKPVVMMSDTEAVEDICRGIDYLHEVSRRTGVRINMHLNPTFVAKGTPLEESFRRGTYSPPQLDDVMRAVLHGAGKSISIFVGLYDEGLSVPGGSFRRPGDDRLVGALESFNRTQDYGALAEFARQIDAG